MAHVSGSDLRTCPHQGLAIVAIPDFFRTQVCREPREQEFVVGMPHPATQANAEACKMRISSTEMMEVRRTINR